jgi:hypothetical protein
MQDGSSLEPVCDNFFVATGGGSVGVVFVFVELILQRLTDGFLQSCSDGIQLVDRGADLIRSTKGRLQVIKDGKASSKGKGKHAPKDFELHRIQKYQKLLIANGRVETLGIRMVREMADVYVIAHRYTVNQIYVGISKQAHNTSKLTPP